MRSWPHEAAAYARLITELVRAGLITDEMIAALPGDTDYLTEQKQRAVALWQETEKHANPQRWLEDLDAEHPDEVLTDLV